MQRLSTRKIGNEGENIACEFLVQNGYEIIARNWRTRTGEIDIIAQKCDIIVFVEVKAIAHCTFDMIEGKINQKKQERILKTSKRFLLNHREYNNKFVRFDVIFVDMLGLCGENSIVPEETWEVLAQVFSVILTDEDYGEKIDKKNWK